VNTARNPRASSIWHEAPFRAYLGATSFARFTFSMQQLLIAWLLIGVLDTSAERVGLSQAIVGVPGLLLMLWGGVSADRVDPRSLLMRVYCVAAVVPLLLVAVDGFGLLHYWTVTAWALLMSVASSYSSPSDSAILNRATGARVQEGVTASTAAGFVVQVLGFTLAGQIDRVGLPTVLIAQAGALLVGAALVARLPVTLRAPLPRVTAWRSVYAGLEVIGQDALLRSVLLVNFASMLFNAGAYTLVVPFLVTKVYGGDAALLGWTLIVFFGGAALTNFVMLRFMPLRNPGRLFLIMQVTRAAIYLALWFEPPLAIVVATMFLWGVNMGITTTLSRTMIQESASEEFRGRILSVYNVGFIGAQPLGAMMLGAVVAAFGILNGLVPGFIVSIAICIYGVMATPIWSYQSAATKAALQ
jgi:predicted MFS family arabinose efflux permease